MADSVMDPTYDLAHQDAALLRRRKMAEAMMAQAMEPIQQQTAGGQVVPISGLQGIAKIAQAMLGRNELDNIDAATKKSDAEYNARLQQATSAYAQMRDSNPMEAFKAAMGSGLKPLQQMAMQDLKGSRMAAKDQTALYEKYTPESIAARRKDPTAALVPLPKIMSVNDQVVPVDQVTGGVQGKPADLRTTYGPVSPDPATGIPMQVANQTGEAKSFTGGNVTPDRAGQNALETNAAGLAVSNIKETHAGMLGAIDTFQRLTNMKTALDEGAKLGPMTDARVYLAKLGETLGLNVKPDAPTETLLMQLGEGVLQDARKLAPVTENDIKMLEKIKGGSISGMDAVKASMDLLERQAVKAYQIHSQALEGLQGDGPGVRSLKATMAAPGFTTVAPKIGSEATTAPKITWK